MADWVTLEETYKLKNGKSGSKETDWVIDRNPIVIDKSLVIMRVCSRVEKVSNACLMVKLVLSGYTPPIFIKKEKEMELWP
jgi:hypothetical protein